MDRGGAFAGRTMRQAERCARGRCREWRDVALGACANAEADRRCRRCPAGRVCGQRRQPSPFRLAVGKPWQSPGDHTCCSQGSAFGEIFLIAVSPTWGLRGFWIRPWLDRYYGLYAQLAQTEGVDFIDARPQWDMSTIRKTVPDGLHPAPQAMQQIVAPYVARRICAAFESIEGNR
jgi:hypothetical protein